MKREPDQQSSNPPTRSRADTRVIVGMSGGVDSSVSAYLLLEAGYQVEGLFMKNWDEDDGTEYCTAKVDLADAQSVADQLGIKLHTANFAAEYWDNVFEHFLTEYRAGRTPNPDILCNREIKFKAFLDYAKLLGADYIATGHYARLNNSSTDSGQRRVELLKGVDPNKDQSYFLHAVVADQLASALFPLGDMQKPEVRDIAAQQGFDNHAKKDSTGICFIGERKFKDFLQQYLPAQPGKIVSDSGELMGEHQGLMYYTLGQRQGIGIGGVREANEAPWYVIHKDIENNCLVVGQGHEHPGMLSTQLIARQINWITPPAEWPLQCKAKTRYRQADQACTVRPNYDGSSSDGSNSHGSNSDRKSGDGSDGYIVEFDTPQRAVTPGQSVVFYQGDICLGGGIIEKCNANAHAKSTNSKVTEPLGHSSG